MLAAWLLLSHMCSHCVCIALILRCCSCSLRGGCCCRCPQAGVKGTVVLASEGFNGSLAGSVAGG